MVSPFSRQPTSKSRFLCNEIPISSIPLRFLTPNNSTKMCGEAKGQAIYWRFSLSSKIARNRYFKITNLLSAGMFPGFPIQIFLYHLRFSSFISDLLVSFQIFSSYVFKNKSVSPWDLINISLRFYQINISPKLIQYFFEIKWIFLRNQIDFPRDQINIS